MPTIRISALGPTIGEQCESLGLRCTGKPAEVVDRISHALTLAHIHGVLTDSEVDRARQRLLKKAKIVMAMREGSIVAEGDGDEGSTPKGQEPGPQDAPNQESGE